MNDSDLKNSAPSGWVIVHTTSDMWEAKLLQTAVLAERIKCRLNPNRKEKSRIDLIVDEDRQEEAEFIVSQALIAISQQSQIANAQAKSKTASSPKGEKSDQIATDRKKSYILKSSPTATHQSVIAQREGIGEIVHFEGQGYELQVGLEPYYSVVEERWEEFTDFSAQRQEFAILLKGEYPRLHKWLKSEKQMAEFIKLVESTYREVPPPKPKKSKAKPKTDTTHQAEAQTKKTSLTASISLLFALIGVLALTFELHLYFKYISSILALPLGLAAKYQISQKEGQLRGNDLASIGIVIASIVLAIALAQG